MSIHVSPLILRTVTRPVGRLAFTPRVPWSVPRRLGDLIRTRPGAAEGMIVTATELDGVPAEVLIPANADARVLLYLHGGGYTVGSPRTHRSLAGRLALATNAVTYVLDYRLAPEARFPAAFDDCLAAYQTLLAAGWRGDQIFVAGDSAGGGLALALGVEGVRRGLPLPAAIGLICPAVDLTDAGIAGVPRDGREPLLTPGLLRRFSDDYLGDADRADPAVSPLLADLTGLPPLVVDASEYDTLCGQSRQLVAKARRAGVTVRHREHAKMPHGFHAFAGVLRQADQALDDIAGDLLALAHSPSSPNSSCTTRQGVE